MVQWCILQKKKQKKKLAMKQLKEQYFSCLVVWIESGLPWVSGHYTRTNEGIFVNVLFLKHNLLPLPPLGLFSDPSVKLVIFFHSLIVFLFVCLLSEAYSLFLERFFCQWHKVYYVLPVAFYWIICASNVQSVHANEAVSVHALLKCKFQTT